MQKKQNNDIQKNLSKVAISWFPGHMAKTRRKINESLSLVDAVAEIVDARIPVASRNPDINELVKNKPRLILLNKCDLSDPAANREWKEYYKSRGITAISVDCKTGRGVDRFVASVKGILSEKLEYYRSKGMVGKTVKVMIVGIPNVGKSSFINCMAKSARAVVADRPGVTRGNQWYKIDKQLELLDTPGVLWPKFDDQTVGENLAFTGAIKDTVVDTETLASLLCGKLSKLYPSALVSRYGIEPPKEDTEPYEILESIAKKRGFIMRGGVLDTERAAAIVLDEFRGGKLGKITLEMPERG